MRDGWYADGRDLIKWSALAHLVQRERLRSVVQVAMFRASKRPTIETATGQVEVPAELWAHFRDVQGIRSLGASAGFEVFIIDELFSARNRVAYFGKVAEQLRQVPEGKAVLLDPDTGFEPRKPNAKHVTEPDIRAIWATLIAQDWLLLYQHQWRQTDWKAVATAKFAAACGGCSV